MPSHLWSNLGLRLDGGSIDSNPLKGQTPRLLLDWTCAKSGQSPSGTYARARFLGARLNALCKKSIFFRCAHSVRIVAHSCSMVCLLKVCLANTLYLIFIAGLFHSFFYFSFLFYLFIYLVLLYILFHFTSIWMHFISICHHSYRYYYYHFLLLFGIFLILKASTVGLGQMPSTSKSTLSKYILGVTGTPVVTE